MRRTVLSCFGSDVCAGGGLMDNIFSWLWIAFLIFALQPLVTERLRAMKRANAIRAVERSQGSRVITMIHRQERRSLLGFPVSRYINLEDAQTLIAAIKETPSDRPIDFIVHTPGGLVLAAMQIARAIEAHPAKVRVMEIGRAHV